MAFPGFTQTLTNVTSGAKINTYFRAARNAAIPTPGSASTGDEGKPTILLLHGFPQNAFMWKNFVNEIPEEYPILIPDLPGYGLSTKAPSPSGDSFAHSKREWGKDIVEVFSQVAPCTSIIAIGHDRGARLAYRLALDYPDRVKAFSVMDVIPTSFVWEFMKLDNNLHRETKSSWHWVFLSSPRPIPETLISSQPSFFFTQLMQRWTGSASLSRPDWSSWASDAVNQYTDPELGYDRIVASCEDYRAGATHDTIFDLEDGLIPQKPGRAFKVPVLVLSSVHLRSRFPVDQIWESVAEKGLVDSYQIGGDKTGHFLVNEEQEEVGRRVREWLKKL